MCSQIVLKPKQAYLEEDDTNALELFSLKVMSLTEKKRLLSAVKSSAKGNKCLTYKIYSVCLMGRYAAAVWNVCVKTKRGNMCFFC